MAPFLKPATRIKPGVCDTGIRHPGDWDCLRCSRCVQGATSRPGSVHKGSGLLFFVIAVLVLLCVHSVASSMAGEEGIKEKARIERPSELRKINKQVIKRLFDSGDLVPRKAMFQEREEKKK